MIIFIIVIVLFQNIYLLGMSVPSLSNEAQVIAALRVARIEFVLKSEPERLSYAAKLYDIVREFLINPSPLCQREALFTMGLLAEHDEYKKPFAEYIIRRLSNAQYEDKQCLYLLIEISKKVIGWCNIPLSLSLWEACFNLRVMNDVRIKCSLIHLLWHVSEFSILSHESIAAAITTFVNLELADPSNEVLGDLCVLCKRLLKKRVDVKNAAKKAFDLNVMKFFKSKEEFIRYMGIDQY